MGKIIDLTGQRFGRLTVIEFAGKDSAHHSRWLCQCSCGNKKIVNRSNLVLGKILSCGCLRREQASQLNRTHGQSDTRLYSIYCNMISRTENPNASAYDCYGGRGIKICAEWRNNFGAFRDWSLSNGYNNNLSIDRIDNDLGYVPSNCRWVPTNEQFNNRRSSCLITYQGTTRTKKQWSRALGINYHTLCNRLAAGWTVERALSTPAGAEASI